MIQHNGVAPIKLYCNCYSTLGFRNNRQKHRSWTEGGKKWRMHMELQVCSVGNLLLTDVYVIPTTAWYSYVPLAPYILVNGSRWLRWQSHCSTRYQISQIFFDVESSKAIDTSVSTSTLPAYIYKASACYFAIVRVLCYGR